MSRSLLLVISGQDQPGITRDLLHALPLNAQILDVQQIQSEGFLTLHVVVQSNDDISRLSKVIRRRLNRFNVDVSIHEGNIRHISSTQNQLVVTVMAQELQVEQLAVVSDAILSLGFNIDTIEKIAQYPVTALEMKVSRGDIMALRPQLAKLSSQHHFDIAVQNGSLQRRGKHLIVLDVDSTLIQEEVIDHLGHFLGVDADIAAITQQAMRGSLDFESALRQRVRLLAGTPLNGLRELRNTLTLSPGARTLMRVLRYLDYKVVFVSGGFDFIVKQLADELGADGFRANQLEIENGRLTGNLVGTVIDRAAKAQALHDFAELYSIPLARTIAIGDGANDIDMINAAGLGIAFNAKPMVRDVADTSLSVPYLDSVLYLLGITRAEVEQLNEELGANNYPLNSNDAR